MVVRLLFLGIRPFPGGGPRTCKKEKCLPPSKRAPKKKKNWKSASGFAATLSRSLEIERVDGSEKWCSPELN